MSDPEKQPDYPQSIVRPGYSAAERSAGPISCRTCRYCVGTNGHAIPPSYPDHTGFCRRQPPVMDPHREATSVFPTVHLDRFWCGEYSRRLITH